MPASNMLQTVSTLITRHWRPLFLLMLVLLHVSAVRGAGDFWTRALMLAHFGLFITWQPFMRGEKRLTGPQLAGIVLVSLGILLFFNWWLLALWVSVLAGIVGGKVFLFQARGLRRFYLVVLTYLVSLLLVWVVPSGMAPALLRSEIRLLAEYGLPLLFAVMLVIPVEPDSAETPQIIDFFYATLLFLMLVVLVLGAFAFMEIGQVDYLVALIYSLLVIAGVLLLLSLAWNPRAGFSGLSMYFSRYLLSIGMPFEQWLYFLAELSQMEARPERFMHEAIQGLAKLPWVAGGTWQAGEDSGEFGQPARDCVEFANRELHLRAYTRQALSPSLEWHFHLLGQLLGEFYMAKVREQKLQQQTYVQAVHETGARVTHDVKNLLQSLNVLCAAAERQSGDPMELNQLMRRQLPVITQRLQQTIERFQKPHSESGRFIKAGVWWDGLTKAYLGRDVEFQNPELQPDVLLPKELFDSAADNLIQNALRKRKLQPDVKVTVELDFSDSFISLNVRDTGEPVAPEVLRGLLRMPVHSESGFGIGLYQAAKLAEATGYALRLTENQPGRVCFSLASRGRWR